MRRIARTALVAAMLAGGGAVATTGTAEAAVISCYSEANPPQAFGPGTVRSYGETTCGDPNSFVLEYRPNVNVPWTNVTSSHSPANGGYQYVYASPVQSGYFRASINHMPGVTTYSADVYLGV